MDVETPQAQCGCEVTAIVVEPTAIGWQLRCDHCEEPMMFLSGHNAEVQAHALAKRLAAAGREAEVTICDRGNVVAGTFAYHVSH